MNKERAKLQEKMNLKMVLKGDQGPVMDDETFRLGTLQSSEVSFFLYFPNPVGCSEPPTDSAEQLFLLNLHKISDLGSRK